MTNRPSSKRIAAIKDRILRWLPSSSLNVGANLPLDVSFLEDRILYSATPLPIDGGETAIDVEASIDEQLVDVEEALQWLADDSLLKEVSTSEQDAEEALESDELESENPLSDGANAHFA